MLAMRTGVVEIRPENLFQVYIIRTHIAVLNLTYMYVDITDVYDSQQYRDVMGPPTPANSADIHRLSLLFCVDGIPAFKNKVLSIKEPGNF